MGEEEAAPSVDLGFIKAEVLSPFLKANPGFIGEATAFARRIDDKDVKAGSPRMRPEYLVDAIAFSVLFMLPDSGEEHQKNILRAFLGISGIKKQEEFARQVINITFGVREDYPKVGRIVVPRFIKQDETDAMYGGWLTMF